MRKVFIGNFRPSDKELGELWQKCIFVVDANVVLNLYRYSTETRNELFKALDEIQERIFITNQAAKEFFKNKLGVTAGQAKEYTKTISSINELLTTLSNKNQHPFLPNKELPKFKKYAEELIESLNNERDLLLEKITKDEILEHIEVLFSEKTGYALEESDLAEILKEGELRYENKIPPGYKDSDKQNENNPSQQYGDLIVWKQIIEHSKTSKKPIIFITDDKKEDWWLQQSGQTIGPRPELIEEFTKETDNQKFWMYTVDKFLQESAKLSKTEVNEEVLEEIKNISFLIAAATKELYSNDILPISTSQETTSVGKYRQTGLLIITINKHIKYATGTGKLTPIFENAPNLEVELVESPYDDSSFVGISSGCGTVTDFNIHMRARKDLLKIGDYVFSYSAFIDERAE